MPAYARSRIVDRNKIQVFHCWARCVRRAFLCGRDPKEGKDYEHRRQWIHDLLQELAGLFSLEIGFHAEMSNHFHLVLRSRPDLVKRWPKEKVVRSWLKIAKLKRGSDEFDWEPSPERVLREMADKKRVNRLRKRLSKVSWFMAPCVNMLLDVAISKTTPKAISGSNATGFAIWPMNPPSWSAVSMSI